MVFHSIIFESCKSEGWEVGISGNTFKGGTTLTVKNSRPNGDGITPTRTGLSQSLKTERKENKNKHILNYRQKKEAGSKHEQAWRTHG